MELTIGMPHLRKSFCWCRPLVFRWNIIKNLSSSRPRVFRWNIIRASIVKNLASFSKYRSRGIVGLLFSCSQDKKEELVSCCVFFFTRNKKLLNNSPSSRKQTRKFTARHWLDGPGVAPRGLGEIRCCMLFAHAVLFCKPTVPCLGTTTLPCLQLPGTSTALRLLINRRLRVVTVQSLKSALCRRSIKITPATVLNSSAACCHCN